MAIPGMKRAAQIISNTALATPVIATTTTHAAALALRGGAIAATEAVFNLDRTRIRLEGLSTYAVIAAVSLPQLLPNCVQANRLSPLTLLFSLYYQSSTS